MAQIKLYGHLAEEFTDSISLAVSSVAEAVVALRVNFEKFYSSVAKEGRTYVVRVDDLDIATQYIGSSPVGINSVIEIIPVVQGSKSEWVTIVVGVALIATGQVWAAGLTKAVAAGTAVSGWSFAGATFLTGVGFAMLSGGLAQLAAPDGVKASNSPDENPSYLFNGAVNTAAQGHTIPVGYGKLRVGSAVISAGIERDQGFTVPPGSVGGSNASKYIESISQTYLVSSSKLGAS